MAIFLRPLPVRVLAGQVVDLGILESGQGFAKYLSQRLGELVLLMVSRRSEIRLDAHAQRVDVPR